MTDEPKDQIEETEDECTSPSTPVKDKNTSQSKAVHTDNAGSPSGENLCTNCQTVFTTVQPGCLAISGVVAILLLCVTLVLLAFVLIFSGGWIWGVVIGLLFVSPLLKAVNKITTTAATCPACGCTNVLPTETPRAKELIKESTSNSPDSR